MKEKIIQLQERLKELDKRLSDPEIFNNQKEYREVSREHNEISKILEVGTPYLKALNALEENKAIVKEDSDPDLVELAKEEIPELEEQVEKLGEKLKLLLIPKHPDDHKNAIMEIRAGTGGDEAAIFAGDLYRMYARYCENHGFKIDVMNSTPSERGGFKEIIFMVEGPEAYGTLKYESGVHRVQRVPETETQGRVHTSAASVVVLPEAEDVDVDIDPNELRIDVFRSSGPGGQSVNTTDSAVRITHLPTGIVVTCQDEKSQHKNKAKALKVLRTRLLDMAQQEQRSAIDAQRKSMVGSGDRSAKIRTYNFPQSRVTDHRIGLTLYKLDRIMEGELDELIEALHLADRNAQLKAQD
ncbi:MAG TPA: peptide chain release factor 1 [Caldithrix abyssi]|uniref:Peptide chain release factor 1 n=1 Tax=Caldithrix abyssi TaxID=187145 RepID=A0A7V5PNF0_CALAY|nr:peptide chain release factor 1 [Caldithrix abyssi]